MHEDLSVQNEIVKPSIFKKAGEMVLMTAGVYIGLKIGEAALDINLPLYTEAAIAAGAGSIAAK